MTRFIPMGGYAVATHDDHYPDGRKCVIAEHPDLPGCMAYGNDEAAALRALTDVRNAYLANVRKHDHMLTPANTTAAYWQMAVVPSVHEVVQPTSGASPSHQTA